MSTNIINKETLETFLALTCGETHSQGNHRYQKIIRKIVSDLCQTIYQFDISDESFGKRLIILISLVNERRRHY